MASSTNLHFSVKGSRVGEVTSMCRFLSLRATNVFSKVIRLIADFCQEAILHIFVCGYKIELLLDPSIHDDHTRTRQWLHRHLPS